jgi:hypothetical protein
MILGPQLVIANPEISTRKSHSFAAQQRVDHSEPFAPVRVALVVFGKGNASLGLMQAFTRLIPNRPRAICSICKAIFASTDD